MSTSKSKNENKNIKALFSVVCLCIVALGLIVYFSTNDNRKVENQVNEQTTLEVTAAVQNPVTIRETTTEKQTEADTTKAKKQKKSEPSTMEQNETNTPYKSYYKYPLGEAVVNGYSEELVYSNTMGDWRSHAAIDFKGEEGDEIVAINDGLVLDVYKDNMYSYVVVIDHGGKLTAKYCGLKSVGVKKGSYVNIGKKIGTLGTIPAESADGAHLHFETEIDGKSVNPLEVMGKIE